MDLEIDSHIYIYVNVYAYVHVNAYVNANVYVNDMYMYMYMYVYAYGPKTGPAFLRFFFALWYFLGGGVGGVTTSCFYVLIDLLR